MEVKVAEDKSSWLKREYLRTSRGRKGAVVSNILDAIARVNKKTAGDVVCETDESGTVKMKILMKKEDLKQVLEAMRDDGKSIIPRYPHPASLSSTSTSSSLEQRLILLRKRQLTRSTQIKIMRQRTSWSPELQSIPEEF